MLQNYITGSVDVVAQAEVVPVVAPLLAVRPHPQVRGPLHQVLRDHRHPIRTPVHHHLHLIRQNEKKLSRQRKVVPCLQAAAVIHTETYLHMLNNRYVIPS